MTRLADALGLTPGQVWTVGLGLLLSCALLTASLQAVQDSRATPAPRPTTTSGEPAP